MATHNPLRWRTHPHQSLKRNPRKSSIPPKIPKHAERTKRETVEREFQEFRAKHEKPAVVEKPAETDEPTFDQLLEKHKDAADPYAAAMREQARNDIKAELAADKQRDAEAKQKAYQEQTAKERETTEQTRIAAFGARMEAALMAQPELQSRMETAGPEFYMTKAMGDGFIESDQPERLIAYLLDHPEEHQTILAMTSGLQQFRAIARIDARLETPATTETSGHPVKSKSAANPPITPVGGGHAAPSSGPPDPKTCTQEEYEAYWNAVEKADRLAGARR